ncbi:MAG TPA: SDR family oxidoreductase [Actinobacteria bacterium]|nr:SDR family oxidoreductase [Actinomycetota bacterium]
MKVFITGITGFAGSYLAEHCLSKGAKVFGIKRWRSQTENLDHIVNKINLLEGDIRDVTSITEVLGEIRPDYIFHLAAQSFVPTSWKAPAETLTTNIIGELNIFETVRELGLDTSIQIAGSSEEYGIVYEDETPITEDNPLRPLSPYGVSKVAQDLLGYQYHQSYGMKIVRTRAFNHEGPKRGEVFVSSNFAKQIAEIEKGLNDPVIKVGNLEAIRDFTDVRDVVRAYWLALEKGEPGDVYNIASGKGIKIKEMLDILLSLTDIKIKVEQDPARMRPSDVPVLIGDSSKFREKTGWQPEISFEKTLKDTLDYWRERV